LKFYFEKLSPTVLSNVSAVFYWKRKEKLLLSSTAPWFTTQPVGRNTLASVVKTMCESVGVKGKTNHSLGATVATRLFEANVPEKLIKERTGHRSADALRLYKLTYICFTRKSSVICNLGFILGFIHT
jgi:integrase